MSLAITIRELCNERGMSVANMARLIGTSPNQMYYNVNRYRDDALEKHIPAIAKVLNVPEEELRDAIDLTYLPDSELQGDAMQNWGKHRHERILAAIRAGESDKKIMADWPDLTGDVLMVYHKIVDGPLSNFSKNGGAYDDRSRNTVLEEFCAIAFKTGSLHFWKDNTQTYDGVGRW